MPNNRFIQYLRSYVACTLLALVSANPLFADLTVRGYNAANAGIHDRFVNDGSFIGNPYDWSGVSSGTAGSTGAGWAVMITPTHFLSANHYHASNGTDLTFYHSNDTTAGSDTRSVVTGQSLGGDLWMGTLNAAVSSDVAIYSILNPSLAAGSEIHVMGLASLTDKGRNQRMGRNQIDRIEYNFDTGIGIGDIFTYDYDNPGGVGDDEARLACQDSGGPSFVIFDGAPALVGIHWFIYSDDVDGEWGDSLIGSGDSFVPGYIDEMNAALDGTGQNITIAGAPEPSSLLLAALMCGPVICCRRRRIPV